MGKKMAPTIQGQGKTRTFDYGKSPCQIAADSEKSGNWSAILDTLLVSSNTPHEADSPSVMNAPKLQTYVTLAVDTRFFWQHLTYQGRFRVIVPSV